MNERIKELAEQAWRAASDEVAHLIRVHNRSYSQDEITDIFEIKFAELIVRECAGLCDQAAEENARTFYTVTETQEVAPALVAKGSQVQAEKLSRQIKKHFGVRE